MAGDEIGEARGGAARKKASASSIRRAASSACAAALGSMAMTSALSSDLWLIFLPTRIMVWKFNECERDGTALISNRTKAFGIHFRVGGGGDPGAGGWGRS